MIKTIRIGQMAGLLFLFALAASAFAQQTPATNSNQEFFEAIRKGDVAGVRTFLQKDPTLAKAVRSSGTTALQYAAYAKQPQIIEMLLATGIQPNIFEAAAIGQVDRVRELLKKDPSLALAWSS